MVSSRVPQARGHYCSVRAGKRSAKEGFDHSDFKRFVLAAYERLELETEGIFQEVGGLRLHRRRFRFRQHGTALGFSPTYRGRNRQFTHTTQSPLLRPSRSRGWPWALGLGAPQLAVHRQRVGRTAGRSGDEPAAVGQAQRARALGLLEGCAHAAAHAVEQPDRGVAAPSLETGSLRSTTRSPAWAAKPTGVGQ